MIPGHCGTFRVASDDLSVATMPENSPTSVVVHTKVLRIVQDTHGLTYELQWKNVQFEPKKTLKKSAYMITYFGSLTLLVLVNVGDSG